MFTKMHLKTGNEKNPSHAMSTAKRLTIVAIFVLGIPYILIYLFKVSGDIAIGKILAIGFFFIVAITFLAYQIFFIPLSSRKQTLEGRVSPESIKIFDLVFRTILFGFLVALVYLEGAPFSFDAYDFLSKNERHIIEGHRYGKRGNILIDRVMAKDGKLYQYPYSTERLKHSHNYTFVSLPRSRMVLSVIESKWSRNNPESN